MESLDASINFVLTVNANTAPTITAIGPQSTNENTPTSAITFTIGDAFTQPGSLTLSGTSSNTTLVPDANITFGGSGASRNVVITPAAGESGTATITITVSDGSLDCFHQFCVNGESPILHQPLQRSHLSQQMKIRLLTNNIYHRRCRNSTQRINPFWYFIKYNAGSKC